jgi:hypothetical protein
VGGDVPRTPEHDVEHLTMLVVTGLRVRMAIYGLQVPFGLPEPQSVILVLLRVHLLFALPLAGRCAIITLLLQLLMVLLHEFLHFPALLDDVTCRVVLWAARASVVAARHLMGVLVTLGTSAPTHRGSSCYSGGSTSQRLVLATGLLVVVLVLAATYLGSIAHIGLATLPRL